MPKIQQLSPHLANLIAAGEVVERPASVVKELVENAIDAGAKTVTVELQNGGMRLIRVQDDGCGMASDDAETAFLRHATSKLRRKEDLEAIGTLGFRGEALAATAAVSRIDLLTRTADEPAGTHLRLEAGKLLLREEAGCPVGTTILVRELFFNTPARMKFMKTDKAETAAALAAVQKQALAHPECGFRFLADGEEKLRSPGDGRTESAIYAVLGRQTAQELLPVDSRWERLRVTGFTSKPSASRGSRNYEIFFVNGRFVKSKTLSAALEEAYRSHIMAGRFPSCVLNLELPLSMVDVNVHPAKTEVKFLNEREAFDCVHYGVLAALNKGSGRVEMQLPKASHSARSEESRHEQGLPVKEQISPQERFGNRPFAGGQCPPLWQQPGATQPETFRQMSAEAYRNYLASLGSAPTVTPDAALLKKVFSKNTLHEDVYYPQGAESTARAEERETDCHTGAAAPVRNDAGEKRAETRLPEVPPPGIAEERAETRLPEAPSPVSAEERAETLLPEAPGWRVVGEVLHTYIIVEEGDGILLIDKHAAHERINYEALLRQGVQVTGQQLLVPRTLSFDPEEIALLEQNKPLLESLGYDFDDLGGGTLLLRQVPADLDEDGAAAALSEIARQLGRGGKETPERLRERLLETVACKAAIKGGWQTQQAELEYLAGQVLSRGDLRTCPHGRPICVSLTRKQLEKQFKRIV